MGLVSKLTLALGALAVGSVAVLVVMARARPPPTPAPQPVRPPQAPPAQPVTVPVTPPKPPVEIQSPPSAPQPESIPALPPQPIVRVIGETDVYIFEERVFPQPPILEPLVTIPIPVREWEIVRDVYPLGSETVTIAISDIKTPKIKLVTYTAPPGYLVAGWGTSGNWDTGDYQAWITLRTTKPIPAPTPTPIVPTPILPVEELTFPNDILKSFTEQGGYAVVFTRMEPYEEQIQYARDALRAIQERTDRRCAFPAIGIWPVPVYRKKDRVQVGSAFVVFATLSQYRDWMSYCKGLIKPALETSFFGTYDYIVEF